MTDQVVEVCFRDCYSTYGEELVRSRVGSGVTQAPFTWPKTVSLTENWRDDLTLVVRVNGVVAGRAVLDKVRYPFAELENLEIMPQFRRQGLASQLVVEAIRHASDLGFSIMHLQTELDNKSAHALYAQQGFLPATQGEMFRMVRFLNYPALSHFLMNHPLAMFQSRGAEKVWELSWTDAISNDTLTIGLSGGSCQFDSNEFGPGIKSLQLQTSDISLKSSISESREVAKDQTFDLQVEIANTGSKAMEGACRLLLNQGFAPADGMQGTANFSLEPGSSQKLALPVQVLETFDDQLWKLRSYPSIAVAAEFFIGDWVFFLSHEVKVA